MAILQLPRIDRRLTNPARSRWYIGYGGESIYIRVNPYGCNIHTQVHCATGHKAGRHGGQVTIAHEFRDSSWLTHFIGGYTPLSCVHVVCMICMYFFSLILVDVLGHTRHYSKHNYQMNCDIILHRYIHTCVCKYIYIHVGMYLLVSISFLCLLFFNVECIFKRSRLAIVCLPAC